MKRLLQDVLATPNATATSNVGIFVEDMEIPSYMDWFPKTFGSTRGEALAQGYSNGLDYLGKQVQALFLQLAGPDVEIVTRKVNDAPQSEAEKRYLQLFESPVDVFFAAVRVPGGVSTLAGPTNDLTPIGYFWFIDDKFRWDPMNRIGRQSSALGNPAEVAALLQEDGSQAPGAGANGGGPASQSQPNVLQPGRNGVTYPTCIECPPPMYSSAGREAGWQGTVKLMVIIQPNGTATDIQVLEGAPYALDANAVVAVEHWRFGPAKGPDGRPVPVRMPIEVTYRLERR